MQKEYKTVLTNHARVRIEERYGIIDGAAALDFAEEAYAGGKRVKDFSGTERRWLTRKAKQKEDEEVIVYKNNLFLYGKPGMDEKRPLITAFMLPDFLTEESRDSFPGEVAFRKKRETMTRREVWDGSERIRKPKIYARLHACLDMDDFEIVC